MREIKCRGYNVFDKEWIYGAYWYDSVVSDSFIIPYGRQATQVNSETIGQFTGLHDKNGVEIYEGDIIKHGEFTGIIEWREDRFIVNWEIECSHQNTLLFWTSKRYIKVIGNIHERSEDNED